MASFRDYVTFATVVLVSGGVLDSATTVVALVHPFFVGQFVEVGNVFIKFFMYDLGLGTTGYFVGDFITWAFEVLVILKAYSDASSFTARGTATLIFLMLILGIGHWAAGVQNIMLLYS